MAVVGEVLEENITGIMRVLTTARKKAACHTDDEIEERVTEYFKACLDSAVLPDIASLALSLGVSKRTLEAWARGYNCSADRQEIIQRAYTTIESAQLQATMKGNFNPILFMFLAKSKYGYREDGSIAGFSDRAVIESGASQNEIADRYKRVYDVSLPELEVHETVPNTASKDVEVIPAEDCEVVLPEEQSEE